MVNKIFRRATNAIRTGLNVGFTSGLVVLFLILIGIPIKMEDSALFLLLLVLFIFGLTLARRMRGQTLGHLLLNTLAMSTAAIVLVFLFMSLINRWQTRGIDVRTYFDSIDLKTMTVLSGVPEDELHPNPAKNPLTGDYPEGADLRTDPMRLTFDRDTGLRLKIGLAGNPWVDVNLVIGGFYGFLLVLALSGLLGAMLTRATIFLNVAHYQQQAVHRVSGNPLTHWTILLLPLPVFALLWLTESQGGRQPVISLGSNSQQVQLLASFLLILAALVAIRSTQPTNWGLTYPARVGLCVGTAGVIAALGIWRILENHTYFIAPPSDPGGSHTFSLGAVLVITGLIVAQNRWALRVPERLESQFAATLSLGLFLIMPLYLDQYQNDVLTLVGINIMLGLGLNIVVGYAGLLDLGYVAFFALGAYTYAFLSSNQVEYDNDQNPLGFKFEGNDDAVLNMATGILTTLVVASVVIYFGLRLWRKRSLDRASNPVSLRPNLLRLPDRPPSSTTLLLTVVAIGTSLIVTVLLRAIGFYELFFDFPSPFLVGLVAAMMVSGISGILLGIPVLRLRGDYLAIVTLGFGEIIRLMFNNLRDFTGGPQGVLLIPRPLPEDASGSVTFLSIVYLVFLGIGLVAFFSMRLKQSRTGRAWGAMRSDERIAQSMGVNLVQSKLMAFAIGATFAGLGGVLFAARQRNIFPGDFNLEVSIEVLSLVIIGGMGSIPGVIMGAIVLIGIPEVLRELSTYRILAFGALLVTMVIIRPKGLLPAPNEQLQERAQALAHQREEGQA